MEDKKKDFYKNNEIYGDEYYINSDNDYNSEYIFNHNNKNNTFDNSNENLKKYQNEKYNIF